MSTGSKTVRITLKGVKINSLIPPAELIGLVPPEPEPAGNPALEIAIADSPLVLRAVLNGKSIRRALKTVAELGAENVNVLLQANLKAPTKPGDPFVLDAAGLTATPKVAKPAPAQEPPTPKPEAS
jgi:hypothetical protein